MNHYKAAQRLSDNRWEYVCFNDGRAYKTGYCAGWREVTDAEEAQIPGLRADVEKRRPNQDKYHTHGHDTAEEACECYRQYLLDNTLRLRPAPETPKTLHRCECPECAEYTAGQASVGDMNIWNLCDGHRTREVVEQLMPAVGECWSSY